MVGDSQLLNRIKRLSKSLPESDIKYAERYISNREFEKLLEIVKSDIYLVQQNEFLEHPKEKFSNINLKELLRLKDTVEEYMSFLEVPNNSEDWVYD